MEEAEEMRQLRRIREAKAEQRKRRDAVESKKLREEWERLRRIKTGEDDHFVTKWGGRQAVDVDHRKYSLSRRGGKATVRSTSQRHERARRAVDQDFSRSRGEKENEEGDDGAAVLSRRRYSRVAVLYERGRTRHIKQNEAVETPPEEEETTRKVEGIVAGWKGQSVTACPEQPCQIFATTADERPFVERCKRLIATIRVAPYCDGASLSESSRASRYFQSSLKKEECEIWCAIGGLSTKLEIGDSNDDDPFFWPWNLMAASRDEDVAKAQLKATCRFVFVEKARVVSPPLRAEKRLCHVGSEWASPFVLNIDRRVQLSLWRGSGVTRRRIDSVVASRSIVCGGLRKNDILRFNNSSGIRYRGFDDDAWLKGGRRAVVFGWIARGGDQKEKGKWAVYEEGKLHVYSRRDALRAKAIIPLPEDQWTVQENEKDWLLSSSSTTILLSNEA